jgi:hypothetical protein
LFVRRFLGEDVTNLGFDKLMEKYEEARIIREFEVGVVSDAVIQAFGGNK